MSLLTNSITSDKDYLKILMSGSTTISANGTPDADSTFPADPAAPFGYSGFKEIEHNLGSVPLVRAFFDPDKNGLWYNTILGVWNGSFIARMDPWMKVIATTTKVKLIMNTDDASPVNDVPVYYRIYDFNAVAVNSDSLIDKIFRIDNTSGSVGPAASSMDAVQTKITIPHDQNEVPLWSMQFADNLDGPWYPEGVQLQGPPDTGSGPPGGPYSRFYYISAFASADKDYFYIHLESNYLYARTLYVRFVLDYKD